VVEINGQVMRMRSTAFCRFRDYAGGDGFVAAMLAMTYPGRSMSLRAKRAFSPERSRMGSNVIVARFAKRRTSRMSGLQPRGDHGPHRHHLTDRV